jgi:tRNA/tmRNA/rRNA uracil-C5-methylase (TrmA/RlmC/RlmD family)
MAAILSLRPRAVGYVSCDPATLARDVAAAVAAGWRLSGLRAFDAFPMTQHVECFATLCPDSERPAP